jgi:gustatory receptor
VSTILLCDQILKQSDQVLALAWKLEVSAAKWNSQQYRQVQIFIEFLECNRPKFTAAGFFSIDRSILFKVLNCAITFVLILIQFKEK